MDRITDCYVLRAQTMCHIFAPFKIDHAWEINHDSEEDLQPEDARTNSEKRYAVYHSGRKIFLLVVERIVECFVRYVSSSLTQPVYMKSVPL